MGTNHDTDLDPSIIQSFSSCRRQLVKAKRYLVDFERDLQSYFASEPYALVVEDHPDGLSECFIIRMVKPPPEELSDLATEVINKSKSALEQACYAAASCAGVPDPKFAAFPVGDTEADFANGIKGRCKDIPTEVVAFLTTLNVHRTGNPLIWALNKIRNRNEHALLVSIGTVGDWDRIFGGTLLMSHQPDTTWDRENNQICLLICFKSQPPDVSIECTFDVCIDQPTPVGTFSALNFLVASIDQVERIVTTIETICNEIIRSHK